MKQSDIFGTLCIAITDWRKHIFWGLAYFTAYNGFQLDLLVFSVVHWEFLELPVDETFIMHSPYGFTSSSVLNIFKFLIGKVALQREGERKIPHLLVHRWPQ